MARGPKKHLKRLNAPSHWMLDKLGGVWAPRPSAGPHKLAECLPLSLILRNRLKYSLNRRETLMIIMRRLVAVDNKVRTDLNYPAGFMDVISIEKTGENFRLLYDHKGRFVLKSVSEKEASYKLLRVMKKAKAKKATIGKNPFFEGQNGSIPYITTHDGRTIKYPHPEIAVNDTIKFDITTGEILDFSKFEVGNLVMITRGANAGRVGIMTAREKHPGGFDLVHITDKKNNKFATRLGNVFVIGDSQRSWVALPKQQGVKLSIEEEAENRLNPKPRKGGKKKN